MKDTILVTGATGFIGSHVVRQLLDSGRHVRILVRSPAKLAQVGLGHEPNLEVIQGDLLDRSTIAPALEGVSQVFHIAGFISTHPKDSQKVVDLNYTITLNLFEECKNRKIEKIVYLASIFALAGACDTPLTETAHYNLSHFDFSYFRAKRKTELYAKQCVEVDGLPIVFMYPGFCYGPGDVYISSSRMIVLFLKRQTPIFIAGGQNALDVRDAASGLILGMDRGKVGEKYLLGGENKTYAELFKLLEEITKLKAPKFAIPKIAGQITGRLAEKILSNPPIDFESSSMAGEYWYYDSSKAISELGFTTRPLRETFHDSVQWLCQNRIAPWPKSWIKKEV